LNRLQSGLKKQAGGIENWKAAFQSFEFSKTPEFLKNRVLKKTALVRSAPR